MNAFKQWSLLFNAEADRYPSNQLHSSHLHLKVLYRKRHQTLLVPVGAKQAHDAVNFFMHKPLLKYWGHLCIKLDDYFPWLHLLPRVEFNAFPFKKLFDQNTTEAAQALHGVAVFCGFPGPLQKLTVYCPDVFGGLGKVAKIAVHATANPAIEKESHWLTKLGQTASTAKFLPKLLKHSVLACERHYVTMTSLPRGDSPSKFGEVHHTFLRALAQQRPLFGPWKRSEANLRLIARLNAITLMVDHPVLLFLKQVHAETENALDDKVLPNLMIHGDFAPWNLRQINGQLVVFDWEYGQTHGNPIQDFLHFHLVTQALKRLGLTTAFMTDLIKQTASYADSQYGADLELSEQCGALTLHYLLDTITFYVEASGYLDPNHPVIRHYMQMLEQRHTWLPQKHDFPTNQSLAFDIQNIDRELP